jgi:O-antigen ligase
MLCNPDTERSAGRLVLPALLAGGLVVAAMRGGSYENLARREMFVLVWWSLGLAGALGLIPRAGLAWPARVAVGAFFALAAWIAIDMTRGDALERELVETVRTLGFAGSLLVVGWTFGRRDWHVAAGFVALAAVSICILAFASRLLPSLLPSAVEEVGIDSRRLSYPFNYWNAVGVWAAMTVSMTLAWSAHAARWWIRGVALAAVCVAVPVAYMTYSRTAAIVTVLAALTVVALSAHRWLAALNVLIAGIGSAAVIFAIRAHSEIANYTGTAGAASVALVSMIVALGCVGASFAAGATALDRFRLPQRTARAGLATGLVALSALGLFAGPSLADRAWDSFNRPAPNVATSNVAGRLTNLSGERRELWKAALDTFRDHPISGSGAGTFEFEWNRSPSWTHTARDAHSIYLEQLAETGLPGALLIVIAFGALLVAVLVAPFRQSSPAARGAAVGLAGAFVAFVVAAGVDWMWESTAVALLAFVCAMLGTASQSRDVAKPRARVRVGITAISLAMLALLIPALVSAQQLDESQHAVRTQHFAEAVATATTAINLQPWSVRAYQQRALVLEKSGLLAAAANDARKAVDLESANYENWLILARIEVERGRTGAGLRAARQARVLHPRGMEFRPE